jgi:hypothetical protein
MTAIVLLWPDAMFGFGCPCLLQSTGPKSVTRHRWCCHRGLGQQEVMALCCSCTAVTTARC